MALSKSGVNRIDLQPKQLRHFLEVVESGSISSACEVLNITQPALSKSIKQLELRLGIDLFQRLPTGVVLTRYGKIFARRARLMEMEYRHALAEIDAAKHGAAGTIRIGAGPDWVDTLLPIAITDFQKNHPRIKFTLESGVMDTLIPRLLNGDLDVIVSSLDFPNHPELIKEHLVDIKHAIFAGLNHPLAKKENVVPSDLTGYSWISPLEDHVGRARLESFFSACELDPPDIRAEVAATFGTILKYVMRGDYLVSAPNIRSEEELRGVKIVLQEDRLWETPAGLAFRYTDKPNPVRNSFITTLRTHFQEFVK